MADGEGENSGDSGSKEKDPAWYRQQIEEKNAENKALRETIRNQMFDSIPGLDRTKGIGKTMTDTYDGELNKGAFLEWAEERFEFKPSTEGGGQNTPDPTAQNVNGIVSQSQQRQEQAVEGGQSLNPPSDLAERIAKAEAEGDYATAISLKTQSLLNK